MTVSWQTREAAAPGVPVQTADHDRGPGVSAAADPDDSRELARTGTVVAVLERGAGELPAAGRGARAAGRHPSSNWYTAASPRSPWTTRTTVPHRSACTRIRRISNGAPGPLAGPQLVGIFNPAKIKPFDPLSRVPLGAYHPVVAAAANAAARTALRGPDLLPDSNLGGYVSQPVDLITSLSALPALENEVRYGTDLPLPDPISVIRVRVAGVTGPERVAGADQGGCPADRRAHAPGRRHRGRVVADPDDTTCQRASSGSRPLP